MSKSHKSKKEKSKGVFDENVYSVNFASKCLSFAGKDDPASQKAPPVQAPTKVDCSKVNTEYFSGSSGKSSGSKLSRKSWSTADSKRSSGAVTGTAQLTKNISAKNIPVSVVSSSAREKQNASVPVSGSQAPGAVSTEYVSGSNASPQKESIKNSNQTATSWSAKPKSKSKKKSTSSRSSKDANSSKSHKSGKHKKSSKKRKSSKPTPTINKSMTAVVPLTPSGSLAVSTSAAVGSNSVNGSTSTGSNGSGDVAMNIPSGSKSSTPRTSAVGNANSTTANENSNSVFSPSRGGKSGANSESSTSANGSTTSGTTSGSASSGSNSTSTSNSIKSKKYSQM